jgi:ABC-type hemin transport system ATPase subunit
MRLVMSLADRIVVLSGGRVLASGSPSAIQRNARVIEAYLGTGAGIRDGRDRSAAEGIDGASAVDRSSP